MRRDTDLVDNVCNELFWDLEVDNNAIAVSAEARTVTLRGIVGSLLEMRAAKNRNERRFSHAYRRPVGEANRPVYRAVPSGPWLARDTR